jgi:hypothetical protein
LKQIIQFAGVIFLFALMLTNAVAGTLPPSGQISAGDLVHAALDAMGGEAKVRALKTVQFKAIGHRHELEQSERPEGPYFVECNQVSESKDLQHNRWKQTTEMTLPMQPKLEVSVTFADGAASRKFGGEEAPASGQALQDAEEALELGPERVLLTALARRDLQRLPNSILQDVPHNGVSFTWRSVPVRIFLNADTNLPTAVEWTRAYPHDTYWSIWGDVTTRVYYSFWWLAKGGIHYPLQTDVFRNGLPDRTLTISELNLNAPLTEELFAISASARSSFQARAKRTTEDRPLGLPGKAAREITRGVVFIPGAWNTTLVQQADGIVVIEAPISSGYSARVIEEAAKRFPGAPIKAVISTSDSWPHIGGVREYVARGIPVYVLDRTRPLLERLVAAPRSFFPDPLATNPREPEFRTV